MIYNHLITNNNFNLKMNDIIYNSPKKDVRLDNMINAILIQFTTLP